MSDQGDPRPMTDQGGSRKGQHLAVSAPELHKVSADAVTSTPLLTSLSSSSCLPSPPAHCGPSLKRLSSKLHLRACSPQLGNRTDGILRDKENGERSAFLCAVIAFPGLGFCRGQTLEHSGRHEEITSPEPGCHPGSVTPCCMILI